MVLASHHLVIHHLLRGSYEAGGNEHAVNHVDDAVGGLNVGCDDLDSVVEEDLAINDADGYIFAQQGRGCIQGDHGFSRDSAFNNMVEQDIGQGAFGIFEQRFDGAFRQCGKGVIGGGEDGELTLAGEGVNQAGSIQGSDQGGEVAVFHGDFRDGLGVFHHLFVRGGHDAGRDEHGVNDVNDAVGGLNVGCNDLDGFVEEDLAINDADGDIFA